MRLAARWLVPGMDGMGSAALRRLAELSPEAQDAAARAALLRGRTEGVRGPSLGPALLGQPGRPHRRGTCCGGGCFFRHGLCEAPLGGRKARTPCCHGGFAEGLGRGVPGRGGSVFGRCRGEEPGPGT